MCRAGNIFHELTQPFNRQLCHESEAMITYNSNAEMYASVPVVKTFYFILNMLSLFNVS